MPVNARHTAVSLLGSVALCAAVLSGCSSSGSDAGASGSSTPKATGDGATQVTAAGKIVAPYLVPPTKIHQTVALTGKIPTSKPWVVITCELPQCQTISDGALAAAKAAGVKTKLLSYKTTDGTTLTSAMKEALTYKPIAVSPVGFTQSLWDSQQSQYKAAGVFITPIAVGDVKTSDVVTTGSASQLDYAASGDRMAAYVTADSNAAGKALVMDVPAFAVLKAYGDGFKAGLAKYCSECSLTTLDLAPAQLASNGVVPAVVSALQKDRSIKYLVATDGAFLVGITAALKSAGITGVKILGGSPDINNLTALKDDSQTAWTAAAEDQYGWVALDIVARKALGMTIPDGDGLRSEMIATKANVGTPDPSGLGYPTDFEAQYKTLWGLS